MSVIRRIGGLIFTHGPLLSSVVLFTGALCRLPCNNCPQQSDLNNLGYICPHKETIVTLTSSSALLKPNSFFTCHCCMNCTLHSEVVKAEGFKYLGSTIKMNRQHTSG